MNFITWLPPLVLDSVVVVFFLFEIAPMCLTPMYVYDFTAGGMFIRNAIFCIAVNLY